MNKILITLLMICIFPSSIYAQQRRGTNQTTAKQSVVSPEDMFLMTTSSMGTAKIYLEKLGYKSGNFSSGLYFYKNTQIKLSTNNNGATTPVMVNPKAGASLILVFPYPDAPYKDYVFFILNTCRSKNIVDRWVAELKKMGYKSQPTESSSAQKRWKYYKPGDQNNTFELIYFISSGEYTLSRIRSE